MPFELHKELLICEQKEAIRWATDRNITTKIFIGHHTLCFRVRPKFKKLVEDALESYHAQGINYEVDGNLSWYECLFKKVQVFR